MSGHSESQSASQAVTKEDRFRRQLECLKNEIEIGQVLVKPVHMSPVVLRNARTRDDREKSLAVMLGEQASPMFVPLAVLSGSVNDRPMSGEAATRPGPSGGRAVAGRPKYSDETTSEESLQNARSACGSPSGNLPCSQWELSAFKCQTRQRNWNCLHGPISSERGTGLFAERSITIDSYSTNLRSRKALHPRLGSQTEMTSPGT